MRRVLVLCTGNSCRSVMAEALINHYGAKSFEAVSAGSKPAGYIHPKSLATLQRHGVPLSDFYSKSWDEFSGQNFDYVITVCDQAANESCPLFHGAPQTLHWSIPDPASATGSEKQIDAAFDAAFMLLKSRIENELL